MKIYLFIMKKGTKSFMTTVVLSRSLERARQNPLIKKNLEEGYKFYLLNELPLFAYLSAFLPINIFYSKKTGWKFI